MGGVACQEHALLLVRVGNNAVSGPWADRQQFKGNIFAKRVTQLFRRVERIQLFLLDAANIQTPQFFAIDGGNGPWTCGLRI